MYIADSYNHRIRKITVSTGIITTIAGTGTNSYSGDGGAATSATLNYPTGLAFDAAGTLLYICLFTTVLTSFSYLGNMYIGDAGNNRIRKVTISTGIITTIAGTGSTSYSGDGGAATAAALYSPRALAFDSLGTAFIHSFTH